MQRKKNKYQVFRLRGDDYELPGRERGEKRVINEGKIFIDYKCFRKTPEEKLRLKIAKAQKE